MSSEFVLGCVPYLNAWPLIKPFELGYLEASVQIQYEVPSRLVEMLDGEQADAVLASSFQVLRTTGLSVAGGVSISTLGAAESVRLFSRVPFEEIASLALDKSSLTSNHLAQVVLAENFEVFPKTVLVPPSLETMLGSCDACVLIGDQGLRAKGEGLFILDLGESWLRMTGLPFVWALWIGGDGLSSELAALLLEAKHRGHAHIKMLAQRASEDFGWEPLLAEHYLTQVMNYDLSPRHLEGLSMFGALLVKHGFLQVAQQPRFVEANLPSPVRGVLFCGSES